MNYMCMREDTHTHTQTVLMSILMQAYVALNFSVPFVPTVNEQILSVQLVATENFLTLLVYFCDRPRYASALPSNAAISANSCISIENSYQ